MCEEPPTTTLARCWSSSRCSWVCHAEARKPPPGGGRRSESVKIQRKAPSPAPAPPPSCSPTLPVHLCLYLLGSPLLLAQPVEALAGLQPAGLVVLAHCPSQTTGASSDELSRLACVSPSTVTSLSCLLLLTLCLCGALSRADGGGGRRVEGGGREHNGVAMTAAATSVYLETVEQTRHAHTRATDVSVSVCVWLKSSPQASHTRRVRPG